MSLIAVGMICFLVVLLANRSISALREEVDEQALLLKQLRESAPQLRDAIEGGQQPSGATKNREAPPPGDPAPGPRDQGGDGRDRPEESPLDPEERSRGLDQEVGRGEASSASPLASSPTSGP